MRRIQCSHCERNLKIPDTIKGNLVRCPCGQTIDLAEPELDELEVVSEEQPEPRKTTRRRTVEDDYDRPKIRKRSKIHGLVPLLIVVPVGLLFLALAPFYKVVAQIGLMLGLTVMIAAIVLAYKGFQKKGYEADLANVPFMLRGGGAMIYYQVKYAIQYPKLLACWVVLQYFGMAWMIASGIIIESVNWAAKEHPFVPPVVKELPRR